MNAQIKIKAPEPLADDQMKHLIWESILILTGQTMKQPTVAHLQALLEERTNTIGALFEARDGLVNAVDALYGRDLTMAKAHLADVENQLKQCDFLSDNWVNGVLHHEPQPEKLGVEK